MHAAHPPSFPLLSLQRFLAGQAPAPDIDAQAAMAASLVDAASCSVMLLDSPDDPGSSMRIHAHHGRLPDTALQAAIRRGEGISGQVLASGKAVLVTDIGRSEFAALARRGAGFGESLISAPIRVEGKVVGVINAANGAGSPPFDDTALALLETAALLIGQTLQLRQLRHLLGSGFARQAMLAETRNAAQDTRLAYRNPDEVARILARSFFRELSSAGFGSAQVVAAASELIGQLNRDLRAERQQEG
ncbi:GAF domain-containing protein [uncultured Massilia sp.]|uniref:GAF domain-containing protein n=1 Tax=uncultured Massilia sp. TaxID=169973 RepID=UPI00258B97C5|nr:GAF domain-containing protein [uncultured Massilia sp.]